MCLLVTCVSSLEKCLFKSSAVYFLFLSCMNYLYMLEIYILSVALFDNTVSHSEGCLFILFMVSLATIIQNNFESPSHGNQRRKRNKRNPNWKRRNKTVIVCRWHDTLHSSRSSSSLVAKSCPTLAIPWTVAYQAPQSMGFSRQEYWSGLPFPSPGDRPNPGIEPSSPALKADS